MQIHFTCPYWGQAHLPAPDFLNNVVRDGYNGIEIDLPASGEFIDALVSGIASIRSHIKKDFIFIVQQVLPLAIETVDDYTSRMKKRLQVLVDLQPDFVNSHTGKDHFSFDDNCRIIEAAMNVAQKSGVRILHETHRGRFSFHAAGLLPYLQKFPEMELVGDFSHFCTVSESLLEDQLPILEKIIPHVGHIHARVGHEQAPQVNDPFAPEWKHHVNTFIIWWKNIIDFRNKAGKKLTITPEFGPAPYMPALPYTLQPTANQWKVNVEIKDLLVHELSLRGERLA